jgi:hypothetical protein
VRDRPGFGWQAGGKIHDAPSGKCVACETELGELLVCPRCGMPAFDEERGAALVGERVLIGLIYQNKDEAEPHCYRQIHGVIESASRTRGFSVVLEGAAAGERYMLPPDLRVFRPLPPGEYTASTTAEVVIDPDYSVSYTVSKGR